MSEQLDYEQRESEHSFLMLKIKFNTNWLICNARNVRECAPENELNPANI